MKSAVQLEQVSKTYDTVQAVKEVTLTVNQGEFFTLLGASGCGKTTLLRLIGGFEIPNSGKIWIGNQDVSRLPAYRRNVHTVFQDYALFPHLSVFENVGFSLQVKRLSRDEVHTRVTDALKLVQLLEMRDRLPSQLSGGQRQRVAIARAIVDHPDVLLLDEPLSALDAKIRVELREELKHLQRQTGISFVYVTHDQEEALALSDRIAVLHNGELLQVGTPLAVYEHPVNLYVAEFIGRANFLAGVLVQVNGKQGQIKIDDQVVTGTLAAEISPNSAVKVVVRPENINFTAEATSDTACAAKIIQSQYLGYATSYLVEMSGLEFHVLELRRRGATPYQEGDRVFLSWEWQEALIFPATDDNLLQPSVEI